VRNAVPIPKKMNPETVESKNQAKFAMVFSDSPVLIAETVCCPINTTILVIRAEIPPIPTYKSRKANAYKRIELSNMGFSTK
jgi:hypothetical protein